MTLLQWDDGFATGIAAADHEHDKLIDHINSIYARWSRGGADRSRLFDEIVGVLRSHFDFEDRLARGSNPTDYDAHARDHEHVLAQLRRMHARAQHPDYDLAAALAPCLQHWLANHIRHFDAPLYRDLVATS